MNGNERERLKLLKERLKHQLHQESLQRERQRFADEIPNFDVDFEFVGEDEQQKINDFVDRLPSISPTQLDLDRFNEVVRYAELKLFPNKGELFYVVCLCGSAETINIFTKGKAECLAR